MSGSSGLFLVWLDVEARHEEELNDWYDLEHVDDVLARVPGVTSVRRYFDPAGSLRWLAWYETADEHVEPGPDFARLVAKPTGWSRRMRRLYGARRVRENYRLAGAFGGEPPADAPALLTLEHDLAEAASRSATREAEASLQAMAAVPGVVRARRYESTAHRGRTLTAFELAAPEVCASADWIAAAAGDGRAVAEAPLVRRLYRLERPTRRRAAG